MRLLKQQCSFVTNKHLLIRGLFICSGLLIPGEETSCTHMHTHLKLSPLSMFWWMLGNVSRARLFIIRTYFLSYASDSFYL